MDAAERRNEVLYQRLQALLPEKVRCDEAEARCNTALLRDVIEQRLIRAMREADHLFDLLYQRIYYTGSYYEGLRVKHANEFDLNLVLNLPIKPADRQITSEGRGMPKSFCLFELKHSLSALLSGHREWQTYRRLETFFDNNRLSPDKIRRWMQSVVDRALPQIGCISGVQRIVPSQHGPAKTLYIYLTNGKNIDVDLVPVIEIKWPEWPQGATKTAVRKFIPSSDRAGKQFWFLVPKPYKGNQNPQHRELLWRLHFPEIEREVIKDRGCVKPLIKLLKLLRDCQGWSALASYYLKTVVLWEVDANPSPDYWKNNKMGELFVLLLQRLLKYLREGSLPYFFYPSYSLIEGMSAEHKENLASRIQRILNILERDPERISTFF